MKDNQTKGSLFKCDDRQPEITKSSIRDLIEAWDKSMENSKKIEM